MHTTSKRLTPMKAIRAKCIDCCGGQLIEVRRCELSSCDLWPYRMGRNPARKGVGGRSGLVAPDDSPRRDNPNSATDSERESIGSMEREQ